MNWFFRQSVMLANQLGDEEVLLSIERDFIPLYRSQIVFFSSLGRVFSLG